MCRLTAVTQSHPGLRICLEPFGVYTFMHHVDARTMGFGVAALLPVSRADTDIAVLQIECVEGLPCPDPHCVVERGGEFGIEA